MSTNEQNICHEEKVVTVTKNIFFVAVTNDFPRSRKQKTQRSSHAIIQSTYLVPAHLFASLVVLLVVVRQQ
jgi:hypothetical protein